MRKTVQQTEDGEKTILIFSSNSEREDFFSQAEKQSKEKQLESVEKLRRAYMDGVKRVDEAYRRSLGELGDLRRTSLLESQVTETPPA